MLLVHLFDGLRYLPTLVEVGDVDKGNNLTLLRFIACPKDMIIKVGHRKVLNSARHWT